MKGKMSKILFFSWAAIYMISAQDPPFDLSVTNNHVNEIVINTVPVVDSVALTEDDYILVYDGNSLIGYTKYRVDTVNIIPTGITTKSTDSINYRIYRGGSYNCYVPVEYAITRNKWSMDYSGPMEVVDMIANTVNVYYPYKLCKNEREVFPFASPVISSIVFSSAAGLDINNDGRINIANSSEGVYNIKMETDFCLVKNELQVEVVATDLIDDRMEINLCEGQSLIDVIDERIGSDNYEWDDSLMIPLDEKDTSIVIREFDNNGCIATRQVVGHYVQSENLVERYNFLCDRTEVLIAGESRLEGIEWGANSPYAEEFTVYRDTSLWVSVLDSNNCMSSKTINVPIRKFQVQNIPYEIEELTCWDYGRISIDGQPENVNGIGPFNYKLRNRLTDTFVSMSAISEGIYCLVAVDSRNCESELERDIVVLKDCLNDYPVFAPNAGAFENDGLTVNPSYKEGIDKTGGQVNNTFFIPYEGYVEIYDRAGRMLIKMEAPIYWDGNDESGNPLPMGSYMMVTDKGKIRNVTIIR